VKKNTSMQELIGFDDAQHNQLGKRNEFSAGSQ
jgi:hypothetical protein